MPDEAIRLSCSPGSELTRSHSPSVISTSTSWQSNPCAWILATSSSAIPCRATFRAERLMERLNARPARFHCANCANPRRKRAAPGAFVAAATQSRYSISPIGSRSRFIAKGTWPSSRPLGQLASTADPPRGQARGGIGHCSCRGVGVAVGGRTPRLVARRLRPLDTVAGSPVDGQRRQRERVVRCSLRHHRSPRGSRAFAAVDRNA